MLPNNIYVTGGSRAAIMITLFDRYLELAEKGYDDQESREEADVLAVVIRNDTLPSKRKVHSFLADERAKIYREMFMVATYFSFGHLP